MQNSCAGILDVHSVIGDQAEPLKMLFVTDRFGNIIVTNTFTALTMGLTLEELQKDNVANLVKKGMYDYSTTLEAIKTKKEVTHHIVTRMGFDVVSTSTPLFDDSGEIYLVVTSSKLDIDEVLETAETETSEKKQYFHSLLSKIIDPNIVAESLAMKNIFKACDQIAPTDCKVLLFGESGTGKEVISNYIHHKSTRAQNNFVSVNCAAIPEALFESELFGHEKGAFTGAAVTKKGLLELADGGTLFLDEISEMPFDMQAKLLRVLETPEIRRVGGTEMIQVNFRLITATNKDLAQMVEQGKFRQDLYYRINVIPIHIPPLRERHLDILGLVNKFVKQFNEKYGKNYSMPSSQYKYLFSHHWPGNIRELKNYIERLVVVDQSYLQLHNDEPVNEDIFIDFESIIANDRKNWPTLKEFLKDAEMQYIQRVLTACDGKKGEAAEQLGIYRTVLYRKLKEYETPAN